MLAKNQKKSLKTEICVKIEIFETKKFDKNQNFVKNRNF